MSDSSDPLNQIMTALQQLQLENEILRDSFRELQARISTTPSLIQPQLPTNPATPEPQLPTMPTLSSPYILESKLSLLDKFDDTRARLRGFINQIRLIIRLQPQRYPTDFSQVGLVGTLLSGPAQAWFAPLVETASPLLENFSEFIADLEATFGETDRRRTALTKLFSLQQGSRPASIYASEFRQLACDVNWDDQALCDQFRRGLRNDVKNLLLNFPEPTSLSQVISQAVQCDNRLFESRLEERGPRRFQPSTRQTPIARPYISAPPASSNLSSSNDAHTPMEIDRTRFQPLTDAQRRYRRDNGLCLYCGTSGHVIRQCPVRNTRQQLYHASAIETSQQQENDHVQP